VSRVGPLDARDFKQAAWKIGLDSRREQLDAVADVVAEYEVGSHALEDIELKELIVNIVLRFLVQVAYHEMLKERRRTSKIVALEDCKQIDLILLEVAYDDLRQSAASLLELLLGAAFRTLRIERLPHRGAFVPAGNQGWLREHPATRTTSTAWRASSASTPCTPSTSSSAASSATTRR